MKKENKRKKEKKYVCCRFKNQGMDLHIELLVDYNRVFSNVVLYLKLR